MFLGSGPFPCGHNARLMVREGRGFLQVYLLTHIWDLKSSLGSLFARF